MSLTKIISRILYHFSRIIGLGYLITALYSIISLLTGWGLQPHGEGKYLFINYPFTQKPFLNIETNLPYIIFSFLLPLILYTLFFWLASNVFKVFHQPKLFTRNNIAALRRFYLFNIFVPCISVVVAGFFVEVESEVWLLIIIHFILGIFTYFLADIFLQGVQLQNEQDLFI